MATPQRFTAGWPSNVRELKALLESHVAVSPGSVPLRAKDLVERLPSAVQVPKRAAVPESKRV